MKLLLLYRRPVFLTWRVSSHGREISTSRLLTSSRIPPRLSLHQWPHRSIATDTAPLNKRAQQSSPSNEEEQEQQSSPSLSDQVRFLMRQVPHPVAIITATDPNSPTPNEAYRGMTVSSFNTVTLYPEPVISFNVKRPSETLHALQTSGHFHVHLLAPSEATAKLARDFSRGNNNLQIVKGEGGFEFFSDSSSETTGQGRGPPVLQRRRKDNSNKDDNDSAVIDFPFIFECRAHSQKIEVYDHTIVLGTVVRTLRHPAAGRRGGISGNARDDDDPHSKEDLCLTYADTRFWKMGEVV